MRMLRAKSALFLVLLILSPEARSDAGDAVKSPAPKTGKRLSPEEARRFLVQVSEKLGTLKTLQAEFVQERHMSAFVDTLTAKGTCYFQAPDKIRWEMAEPYRSALVFSEGKVAKFMYERDRWRRLDLGSKEIMKEVLKLISLWMRGDFESSKELFELALRRDGAVVVNLIPRFEQMKEVLSLIELTVDAESKHIDKVTIQEPRGDEIVITFVDKKWNIELDEDLFKLD